MNWRHNKVYFVIALGVVSASFALRVSGPSHAGRKVALAKPAKLDRPATARVMEAYGKLPMSFEVNRGQTDPQVKFLSRGGGYSLFLTSTEAVLALQGSEGRPIDRNPKAKIVEKLLAHHPLSNSAAFALLLRLGIPSSQHRAFLPQPGGERTLMRSEMQGSPESKPAAALRLKLLAANPAPRVSGLEELPGKSNYFRGRDPRKWRTNVPTYASVKYADVYPGVDLVYYGNQGQLEYDFIVAPGANPRAIALSLQGAERLNVDAQGDLVVGVNGEEVRFHRPVLYQSGNWGPEISTDARMQIDGRYLLQGENQVGFQVAAYDASKPLIIDPVLRYSTYLGGSGDDFSFGPDALAVDPRGNAYIIGSTNSTDFPITPGAFQTAFGGTGDFFSGDAFVAKLNAAGQLLYSTYLGGSSDEQGESIAVDAAGNAYIAGETFSTDFPTMNPIQANNAGGDDSFLAKLNPAGDGLVYSTYLGGSDSDLVPMIEIDASGNLYAQGWTFSDDFPTTAGAFQTTLAGTPDTYVVKVNPAGNALVYSTYLGGSDFEICGQQIAVDHFGNVYVNGVTNSTDFPTTRGAIQTALATPARAAMSLTLSPALTAS